jgi:multidrug efflux pump subunit AcrA (membrane-fusion protein)
MMQRNQSNQLIPVLMALAILQGCSAESDKPQEENDNRAAKTNSARIEIPTTIQRNLGIEFTKVQVRRVAQTLRVPGAFELLPLARREYRLALPGRVELLVDQNQAVTPGQVLYRYQSTAWPELLHEIIEGEQAIATANGKIKVARTRSSEARTKLELARERLRLLARAEFKRADLEASALELEASLPRLQAELELAQTALSNAQRTRGHALHRAAAAVGLTEKDLLQEVQVGDRTMAAYETYDWIEVRAEHGGFVELLALTNGSFAEAPSLVLSTVDTSQVRFRALALQADLSRIGTINEVRIVPPLSPGMAPDAGVPATMTLGLVAHPIERTMTLLAIPKDQAPWIRPGVSAFLEIVVASSDGPQLAVPTSAVLRDGLTHVFFRRDPEDPGVAIRVEADLGISDGRWVVIQSGLMRSDEVVSAGAYELKLATQQESSPAIGGHMHADGTFHEGED